MLYLQVIPYRIRDQVVLDQPAKKRRIAIRVAEIDAGARTNDHIIADHPVPGGALGRDPNPLLISAIATDEQAVQGNVMGPVTG